MVLLELNLKISQYIKDRNNLFSHLIWTCGESNQKLTSFYFTHNTKREISNQYSTIGDTSLKMSIINLNIPYYGEARSSNAFNEAGKTITFQADIYSNYTCRLFIYTYINGAYSHNHVIIPPNTSGTFSVTRTIPQDTEHTLFRVEPIEYSYENAFCYTDNWKLTL